MPSTYPRLRCIHLPDYDYASPGNYFITLVTEDRMPLFGTIKDDAVTLSPAGQMVQDALQGLADHYSHVSLDAVIVMPTHLHAILVLEEGNTLTLHEIIRRFKTFTTNLYRRDIDPTHRTEEWHLWQARYHDTVIRNERQLAALRRYIENNPRQWELDAENPERKTQRAWGSEIGRRRSVGRTQQEAGPYRT